MVARLTAEEKAKREKARADKAKTRKDEQDKKRAAMEKTAKERAVAKKPSGLDACALVLKEAGAGAELSCSEMVTTAIEKGYWESNGLTPANTMHAAIGREIRVKPKDSRFKKGKKKGTFALAV